MRPWLLSAIVCFLIVAVLLADNIVVTTQGDTQTSNVEKMVDFLIDTQFNGNLGLCREAPTAAPNTYWLASDNIWAWKALTLAANQPGLANAAEAGTTAQKIKNSLTNLAVQYKSPTDSNGMPESFCHEAVIGDPVHPPYETNNPLTLYSGAYTLKTDMRNGDPMSDWSNYSDLALYGALSYCWQNNDAAALSYYNRAVGMWNETSQGLQDAGNTNFTTGATVGDYSTYKAALLLYVSNLLGQNPSFKGELFNKLYTQQAENGGVTTDYYANGTPTGDENTETTAIAIIALLTVPSTLYSVTVNVGAGGQSNILSTTVQSGTTLNFNFTPIKGYCISSVTVNSRSVKVSSILTITVTGNTVVNVSFSILTYNITVYVGSNGQVIPNGTLTVIYGANQTFEVIPDNGYQIDTAYINQTMTKNYTLVNIQASYAFNATFAVNPSTPTPSPFTLEVTSVIVLALIAVTILLVILVFKRPFQHLASRTQGQISTKLNFS